MPKKKRRAAASDAQNFGDECPDGCSGDRAQALLAGLRPGAQLGLKIVSGLYRGRRSYMLAPIDEEFAAQLKPL